MKQMNWMTVLGIFFAIYGMVGCTSTLTAEQEQAEIYRKYPGINYGPLVGTPNYDREKK